MLGDSYTERPYKVLNNMHQVNIET